MQAAASPSTIDPGALIVSANGAGRAAFAR
jgi:hypothetical protein